MNPKPSEEAELQQLRDLVYRLKYPPTKGAYQVKVDDVMEALMKWHHKRIVAELEGLRTFDEGSVVTKESVPLTIMERLQDRLEHFRSLI